jgi:predicted TIM-barrel fold metal-dependent hydrolase
MLGYSVPGWIKSPERRALMRDLVCWTVQIFGPSRCMVATNWWKSAGLSDSDGHSDIGPDPVQLITLLSEFLDDYSHEDQNRIFCGTAREFYNI